MELNLIDVFGTLLLNSLIIWGFYYAFLPDMIFSSIADWFDTITIERIKDDNVVETVYLLEWLEKPLFSCPYCMASLHSYLFFTLDLPIYFWPFYILALCGFNGWVANYVDVT